MRRPSRSCPRLPTRCWCRRFVNFHSPTAPPFVILRIRSRFCVCIGDAKAAARAQVNRYVPAVSDLLERFRFVPNWRVDDVMVRPRSLSPVSVASSHPTILSGWKAGQFKTGGGSRVEIDSHTQACTRTHVHAHERARARTHTHTHTHTAVRAGVLRRQGRRGERP